MPPWDVVKSSIKLWKNYGKVHSCCMIATKEIVANKMWSHH